MFKSRIIVDLPSVERERVMGHMDRLKSFFGKEVDLRSGVEELTVSALSLVTGIVDAFESAGVQDVISFIVDRRVIYQDSHEVADDLRLMLEAALHKGVLHQQFREMHIVLSHKDEDVLHTLMDVRIVSEVLIGEAEMDVECSARIPLLRIEPGETAEAYADRISETAEDEGAFELARLRLQALTERVSDALRRVLVGAKVDIAQEAILRLIRTEPYTLTRFPHLKFGDDVQTPQYRAQPSPHRHGAYHDPFY